MAKCINSIRVVSHEVLGNAPPGYLLIEVAVHGILVVTAEMNPHTNGEWRWSGDAHPTEFMTEIADALYVALAGCTGFKSPMARGF